MVKRIEPELNETFIMKGNSLIHIIEGSGEIQVDFRNYSNWRDKAIFLEAGQYIKFLSNRFVIRLIEFEDDRFYNAEVRVLFKHLISLGYIDIMECDDCMKFFSGSVFSSEVSHIIDVSTKQWYWQNPFDASKREYQIIFDAKEIIDTQYTGNLSVPDLIECINHRGYNVQQLLKNKIGISVKGLLSRKKEKESKKQIVFSDRNIQEIAFDMGYSDPAYFNKVFKANTGQTPLEFRKNFDFDQRDTFVSDISDLLMEHHKTERAVGFYANKMNLSLSALSRKVSQRMNTSLGKLIRWEILHTAKLHLLAGETVSEVALFLGFKESNHFTRFFKNAVGETPSEFVLRKKYNN
jgi:AraC-like DNA-binding protein